MLRSVVQQDGVCRKTIDRRRNVQSIAWLPGGEGECCFDNLELPYTSSGTKLGRSNTVYLGFLSVEGSDVTKLDLTGNVLAMYHFERLIIHDVAVTQDQARMVCVGTLTA